MGFSRFPRGGTPPLPWRCIDFKPRLECALQLHGVSLGTLQRGMDVRRPLPSHGNRTLQRAVNVQIPSRATEMPTGVKLGRRSRLSKSSFGTIRQPKSQFKYGNISIL